MKHTYLSSTKSVLRTDIRVMAGDTGNQGAGEPTRFEDDHIHSDGQCPHCATA